MSVPRDIPAAVKLQLRREAGFGCCACGHPFYEYQHIKPFSIEPHHDPQHMMVLCPNHHHQATVGALDDGEQRRCKADPFNVRRGYANGQLIITSRLVALQLGSNQFVGAGFKLMVDDHPLLQLQADPEGRLSLSVDLYDEADTQILCLVDNEWVTGDPLPWDLQFGYRWLKVRLKGRDIALDLDAREDLVSLRGRLWRKGQCFTIDESSLMVNGVVQNSGLIDLCLVGLIVGLDTKERKFTITPDPTFGKGMIVSWPDVAERVRRGIEAYERLLASKGASA